jgi:hypothetical protein
MTEESKTRKKQIEIPFLFPSDAPRIYATGAFGGYTPTDFRVMLFSEEPLQQDAITTTRDLGIKRDVQAELILAPLAAKIIAQWLTKKVEDFEKNVGPIPSPKPKNVENEKK